MNKDETHYKLETIKLKNQEINLAIPKNFNSNLKYDIYLIFDGKNLLNNSETNILNNNQSNKIFVGLNSTNDANRFNNLSTYHNSSVKSLMTNYFPELTKEKNNYLGGEGQEYLNFIENDLLDWIINIKKINISNLNLLGCSMGAYFSLQMLYLSKLTFKKVFIFSPSIWFNEKILKDLTIKKLNKQKPLIINLWVGLKEPKYFEKTITTNYYQEAITVKNILTTNQQIKVNFFIEETGGHGFKWWINFINTHQELL